MSLSAGIWYGISGLVPLHPISTLNQINHKNTVETLRTKAAASELGTAADKNQLKQGVSDQE